MKAWHFSENAYPYLPPADEYESIRVSLPNRFYDPKKGATLYDLQMEALALAGLMLLAMTLAVRRFRTTLD